MTDTNERMSEADISLHECIHLPEVCECDDDLPAYTTECTACQSRRIITQLRTDLAAANKRAERANQATVEAVEHGLKIADTLRSQLGEAREAGWEVVQKMGRLLERESESSDGEKIRLRQDAHRAADTLRDTLSRLAEADDNQSKLDRDERGSDEGEGDSSCSCDKPSCDNDGICHNCGKDAVE